MERSAAIYAKCSEPAGFIQAARWQIAISYWHVSRGPASPWIA
jgi:hypothetical protein